MTCRDFKNLLPFFTRAGIAVTGFGHPLYHMSFWIFFCFFNCGKAARFCAAANLKGFTTFCQGPHLLSLIDFGMRDDAVGRCNRDHIR